MKLEFTGSSEIAAPREKVWQRLMDPNFIAAFGPGVESVEVVDPTHFTVVSGLGVGALKVKFKLDVELSDVAPPERVRMTARGHAPGSAVDVASNVWLIEAGDGRTRLDWAATSTLSGAVASIGGRFLEGTARRLTEQFWNDFARRVSAG
ncbi:MAG TPA: carbon monoxide dehydrogenase subunit G [Gemmatimonadales bacterium]|nr:carbon monoxide dehydrogenase subunit G [Gemmatimonadales bacterium]